MALQRKSGETHARAHAGGRDPTLMVCPAPRMQLDRAWLEQKALQPSTGQSAQPQPSRGEAPAAPRIARPASRPLSTQHEQVTTIETPVWASGFRLKV